MDHKNEENPTEKIVENSIQDKLEEEIYLPSVETLDEINLVYENEKYIIKDDKNFKSGKYAIKIEGAKEKKQITIKNLSLDQHAFLSMWLMSSGMEDVNIIVEGYKKQQIIFTKPIIFYPTKPYIWELMNVDQDLEGIDEVKIIFLNKASDIWIDDISLDAYK